MTDENKKNGEDVLNKDSLSTSEKRESAENDSSPRISLDWYKRERRSTRASTWMHLFTLVIMLAALLLLFMFKDRCGQTVSNILFYASPQGVNKKTTEPKPEISPEPATNKK